MLALAHPLQSHSPHDTPSAASRSKPVTRRTPSSAAATSSSSLSSYSSSGSSTAPASTITSASSSRSSLLVNHNRPEAALPSKFDTILPHAPPPTYSSPRHALQRHSGHSQNVVEQHTPPTLSSVQAPPPTPQSDTSIDIHTYPSNDLLRLLASLLNQIASANDARSPQSSQNSHSTAQSIPHSPTEEECPLWHTLTTASRQALSTPTSPLSFHARNIPSISLESYLLRILRYCPTTNDVFLSLLVYFDRMSKLAHEATGQRFAIDSYNVHRLVIAGITVASKFFSDVFYTNSRYAKVGGLPQPELNQLELQFLLLNDFRLVIPTEEMQRYAEQLIAFSELQSRQPDGNTLRLSTATPPVSVIPQTVQPSRPLQSMGAFDAYGGPSAVARDDSLNVHRNSTPKHSATAVPYSVAFADEERDPDSSVCSETDTDAETDDEPTIRPTHSCASSETQSVCSTDTNDDDDEEDAAYRYAPTRRPQPSRSWTDASAESASTGDRRMYSP